MRPTQVIAHIDLPKSGEYVVYVRNNANTVARGHHWQ